MTVRIVEDYWENVTAHGQLIRKLFTYLFTKRYPIYGGMDDAYQNVLVKLHHLNIFSRFNRQLGQKDKPTQKKFEQYMFKWVEHILEEMYSSQRRYQAVFGGKMPASLEKARHRSRPDKEGSFEDPNCPTPSTRRGTQSIEKGARADFDKRRTVKRPGIDDLHDYMSEGDPDAEYQLETADFRNVIYDACRNNIEREIVRMREEDFMSGADISKKLKCTPQNISRLLSEIKARALRAYQLA